MQKNLIKKLFCVIGNQCIIDYSGYYLISMNCPLTEFGKMIKWVKQF